MVEMLDELVLDAGTPGPTRQQQPARARAIAGHPDWVPRHSEAAPKLLIHDADFLATRDLANRLRTSMGSDIHISVVADLHAISEAGTTNVPRDVDIIAIRLDAGCAEALGTALSLKASLPWVQIVLWADDAASRLDIQAARGLGITNILPASGFVDWMAQAATPLARVARAQRDIAIFSAQVPEYPRIDEGDRRERSSLPNAERAFRENYLRLLLLQSETNREAADLAGVPYTTLCSMLKKLGLRR